MFVCIYEAKRHIIHLKLLIFLFFSEALSMRHQFQLSLSMSNYKQKDNYLSIVINLN